MAIEEKADDGVLYAMPWCDFPKHIRESVIANLEYDAGDMTCSCFRKLPSGACADKNGCEIRSAAFTAAAAALRKLAP